MRILSSALLLSAGTLLAGCAVDPSRDLDQIPIATPRQPALQDEVAAVRIGQFVESSERSEQELALLFYQRGLYFSRLGLDWLAHVDFRRAVELGPDFAEAYNQLGVQFTLLDQFDDAYEAFDSAIELEPANDFALLNRGIALHYAGRHQLALRDLEIYYRRQTDDPYRAIWLYLVQYPLAPEQAQQRLASIAPVLRPGWGKTLVHYLLGRMTDGELLELSQIQGELQEGEPQSLEERLCEAYFYMGQQALKRRQIERAANYFRLSAATNIYEFVEHNFALYELRRLDLDSEWSAEDGPQ